MSTVEEFRVVVVKPFYSYVSGIHKFAIRERVTVIERMELADVVRMVDRMHLHPGVEVRLTPIRSK